MLETVSLKEFEEQHAIGVGLRGVVAWNASIRQGASHPRVEVAIDNNPISSSAQVSDLFRKYLIYTAVPFGVAVVSAVEAKVDGGDSCTALLGLVGHPHPLLIYILKIRVLNFWVEFAEAYSRRLP